jgi:hypothetical protein
MTLQETDDKEDEKEAGVIIIFRRAGQKRLMAATENGEFVLGIPE